MAVDYQRIGHRIQVRRKGLGKTQDNLAEALAVSVGYVSQLERGVTKINLDTLAAIAAWLGCGMDELLTGVNTEQGDYLAEEALRLFEQMNEQQKRLFLAIGEDILRVAGEEEQKG